MFKIQTHYRVIAVFLFVLTLSVLSGGKAHAASFVVNTTADDPDTNLNGTCADDINGDCTLRAAIQEINDIGDSSNTITIPAGNITLTDNLPDINVTVNIQGAGMDATVIDGGSGAHTVIRGGASNMTISGLTITGYRNVALQFGGNGSLDLSFIEIDGTGSQTDSTFAFGGLLAAAPNVSIDNTHVHSISASGLAFSVYGMVLQSGQGMTSNISLSNSTIQNISSQDVSVAGISLATGLLDGSLTPANINFEIKNTTISNLNGGGAGAIGVASVPAVNGGDSEINIVAKNNTISDIVGGSGGAFGSANAILLTGAALGAQDTATSTFMGTNNILQSSQFSCASNSDAAPLLGAGTSGGTVSNTYASNGGNLSSNNTCTPYFSQPKDQNNLTNLASTLGPLSFNGGSVPTIPLLQGSPAIDSGVTVAGLTADARGAARPQGSAYDSGAYESPYTKPVTSLAGTGQNTALFMAIATSMLTLATGVIVLRRQHFN